MVKMARKLSRLEQKRLQKKTEEAKKRGGVSASLFLEAEMNVLTNADCFFFYGNRRRPKALLTVFFPDETHGEITVASFGKEEHALPVLFQNAIRACKGVGAEHLHTVRNPACGFSFAGIEGISFTYAWSEYMLCASVGQLAAVREESGPDETVLEKCSAPEGDGTVCYRLFQNGEETAECRILPAGGGKQLYLFGLKTKEEYRNRGMATRLIREIAKEYATEETAVMRLQVSSENVPAERLYRKLGFRTEEQREYYKTEEC